MNKMQSIFLIIVVFIFQACTFDKNTIKSVAQTNSATQIDEFKAEILKELINYKKKLDLRNPNAYNKNLQTSIIQEIRDNKDFINLVQDGKVLENSDEYFYYAFSPKKIENRNDLLILGLYKMIFEAFMMDKEHQFAALSYDREKMIKLYEYLQVVRWKIKILKDDKNEYLFNTWQNNWQLEFTKRFESDFNIIKDLAYIKANKESILDPSNFSYEIVLSKIIVNVEHSLRKINVEPYEMSLSALKSFIFII